MFDQPVGHFPLFRQDGLNGWDGGGRPMFRHVKQLQYTVRVAEPNPGLANLLLEQFGGQQRARYTAVVSHDET
jgi:hypothetical protein